MSQGMKITNESTKIEREAVLKTVQSLIDLYQMIPTLRSIPGPYISEIFP